MPHLLIVGGSDAGIAAALRSREFDPSLDVTVVVADRYPNYSVCGLPYFLSGEVADWRNLAHRTAPEIERQGIKLLLDHRAVRLDPVRRVVAVRAEGEAGEKEIVYDRLVVGTGADPVRPAFPGNDLPGVYLLRSMGDSFAVHRHLTERAPRAAVVVGGGYIGVEMAEALTVRGLEVTLVEHGRTVLKTLDSPLGTVVQGELERHGVRVTTGARVRAVEPCGDRLTVVGDEFRHEADLVLVAVGVRPQVELLVGAGAEVGLKGSIRVNRRMETGLPGVYAAGDCTETWHRLLGRNVYLPLGSTAHKQGRVAGENAAGGDREFAGTLGTQVVKVYGLAATRTGLNDAEARDAGFDPLTVQSRASDHKGYYPGAGELHLRVTGDRKTGRLLGGQIVGPVAGEVAKRIDIFAAAIHHGMTVNGLSDLDLSYTPPLGSPWDAVQMSGHAWERAKASA